MDWKCRRRWRECRESDKSASDGEKCGVMKDMEVNSHTETELSSETPRR